MAEGGNGTSLSRMYEARLQKCDACELGLAVQIQLLLGVVGSINGGIANRLMKGTRKCLV